MYRKYFESMYEECSRHVDAIKKSKWVGCFHCETIYHPRDITEWTDLEATAICPHCGVDAVLPYMDDINRTYATLRIMNTMYFVGEMKEPKLTKELHSSVYDYIQEGPVEINAKTLLHMYLFMLNYLDVGKQHVTLRGLLELFKTLNVEVPEILKEFDGGGS